METCLVALNSLSTINDKYMVEQHTAVYPSLHSYYVYYKGKCKKKNRRTTEEQRLAQPVSARPFVREVSHVLNRSISPFLFVLPYVALNTRKTEHW